MEFQVQPSTQTPAIPPEIWMRIAELIPHTELCSMFSINHVFFECSIDARYRELSFSTDSDAEALWRLGRARDLSISHRVRSLDICLTGCKFYKQFDENGKLNPGWTGIHLWRGIQMMTETITILPNITELSVVWFGSPPKEDLVPFLTVAWKSLGYGLRKLSFQVSLIELPTLLSTADGLVSLRDLDVEFSGKKLVDESEVQALATVLAPFVNKVGPTLHSLSFCSRLHGLDVTPFFHGLSTIPNLEKLCVVIVDDDFPPRSLPRFICNHATTLRHIEWDQRWRNSPRQDCMDWLGGNDLEEAFSNLRTLRIRVPENPSCFSIMVEHIKLSAITMTSLRLLDYNMTYEEANALISLFAPNCGGSLRELSVQVKFLSPELILLLAQTLPLLETLAMHIIHVTGHEADKGSSKAIDGENYEKRMQEEFLNAEIFAGIMRTYDFRGWVLHDIHIDMDFWWDDRLPLKLMWVLAECVPSLQKFRGNDKKLHAIPHDDRL